MTLIRMEIAMDTENRLESAKLAAGLAQAAELGRIAGIKSQVRVIYCTAENDDGSNPILIPQAVSYDLRQDARDRFQREQRLNELRDYELKEFDFQARTLTLLEASGIDTIGQLHSLTDKELGTLPGVGQKTVEDIRETLNRQGL